MLDVADLIRFYCSDHLFEADLQRKTPLRAGLHLFIINVVEEFSLKGLFAKLAPKKSSPGFTICIAYTTGCNTHVIGIHNHTNMFRS